jgi:YegS/Rv2252/BmrU family lipid kinase
MPDALLIYNPAAGRISVKPFIKGVVRVLTSNGWQVQVAETLNGRHTTQLANQAARDSFHAAFAIGGDGTVGQVASGLIGSQTALGVLPAGTANVWARELGLPAFTWTHLNSLRKNSRVLATSPIHEVDVGLCNGQPFLMWTGIGLDAMSVHKLEPRKRFYKYLSVPHFAAATIYNASVWHGMNLDVWADDIKVEGHYLLAVASNIRHYLGGMAMISPQAQIDDGCMELWLFSGSNLADAFRHFFGMTSGRHLNSVHTRCIKYKRLRIESEIPFSIQMDGEPMLGGRLAEISMLPRGLRVLLPPIACQYLCNSPLYNLENSQPARPEIPFFGIQAFS